MIIFLISAVFGGIQVLLTERLMIAFNERHSKNIFKFFGIKFLLYAVGVGLVMLRFVWHISLCICGFAVGVPITALALYFIRTLYGGEFVIWYKRSYKKIKAYLKSLKRKFKK